VRAVPTNAATAALAHATRCLRATAIASAAAVNGVGKTLPADRRLCSRSRRKSSASGRSPALSTLPGAAASAAATGSQTAKRREGSAHANQSCSARPSRPEASAERTQLPGRRLNGAAGARRWALTRTSSTNPATGPIRVTAPQRARGSRGVPPAFSGGQTWHRSPALWLASRRVTWRGRYANRSQLGIQEDSEAAESEKQDNNYGWDINLGGPSRWWTVTWVACELRGNSGESCPHSPLCAVSTGMLGQYRSRPDVAALAVIDFATRWEPYLT